MRREMGGSVAALLIVGVVTYLVVWPWYAAPSAAAVTNAWSDVERTAAGTPMVARSDDARYEAFVAATSATRADLGDRIREEAADPNAARRPLPPSVDAAVLALRAWSAALGPPEPASSARCGERKDLALPMVLSTLARKTLVAAPDSTTLATDLVRLSEHLRREGTLVDYALGLKVLDAVVDWAKKRGAAPDFLVGTAAGPRELEAAIARRYVCVDRDIEDTSMLGFTSLVVTDRPWFTHVYVRAARERDVARLYAADLLARCRPQLADPIAYVDCTAEGPTSLPKSVAVRALAFRPLPTGAGPILARYLAASKH